MTDCSTNIQVPPPYCTYDCVGTNYCSAGKVGIGGMYSNACCELDPFAQTWIRGADEANLTMPFCPGYRQQSVDRFVSYCDFHPPYTNLSLFGCSQKTVPRYFANHTYFDTWITFKKGAIDQAPSTTSNLITSM